MAEPVAVLAGGDSGAVGEFLLFDGSGSYDPDGTIFRWRCSFGDGGKAQGKGHPGTFGHAYQAEGSYKLQFVVTDNRKQRSATLTRIITIGAEETDPDPDTVPDAFTFAPQTGVARSTVITSNTITISGITAASPITVVGGTYSINGGSFVSTAGSITNSQTVAVRHTSSAEYASATETQLTIGGVTGFFEVLTESEAIDTTPDPFAFQAQVGAATATVVESNVVTIQGINTPVPITISGASGEYSIDGAAYTTSAGTISNGQRLRVKLTSSGSNSTAVTTTVTVGTATATFTVTTVAAPADDGTPDPFGWPSITGQPITTVVTSSSITVSGINTTVDISVAGGGSPQYSINGGAFTSSPGSGTVSDGNTIRVRLTSSGTQGVTLTASVTIGGVVGSFSVTTALVTVSGTTYFVSTTGNNGAAGGEGTPWATLQFALSRVVPGDEIQMRGGTHTNRVTSGGGFIRSGLSWDTGKYINVTKYTGETPILAPSSGGDALKLDNNEQFIQFDGLNFRITTINSAIAIVGPPNGNGTLGTAHHIRIQNAAVSSTTASNTGGSGLIWENTRFNEFINLDVSGIGGPYGFYLRGDNTLVEGCDIHGVSRGGIHVYFPESQPTNIVIRQNRIRSITVTDIAGETFGVLLTGSGHQVYNNLFYDLDLPGAGSGNMAIVVYTGTGHRLWHNTIANCSGTGGIKVEAGASSVETRNNIAYNNAFSAYTNAGGSTNVQSHNLFGTNPLFVSLAGNDFALTASSPARNAGLFIPNVTSDFAGLSRPQGSGVDIGAYEYDE